MPPADAAHFHAVAPIAFQTMRIVAEGADVFECLRVLRRIDTVDDWGPEMSAAAKTWFARGEEAERCGHVISARDAYLQAKHFFLAAATWNVPDPALTTGTYLRCVESFRRAARLSEPRIVPVGIPFGSVELPGYLYLPAGGAPRPLPTAIVMGGTDATKEEADGLGAADCARRGLAALTFDGPGQGESIRLHGLTTRHDYEVVFGAALDFLERRPEVDSARIGIVGVSAGGYYGIRGALDDRVRAVVVHGAVFDFVEDSVRLARRPIHPLFQMLSGRNDPDEVVAFFRRLHVREVVDAVRCPVLIVHSGEDQIVAPEAAQRLYDALPGERELVFIDDGLHCCIEYFAQLKPRMYDWLADKLTA